MEDYDVINKPIHYNRIGAMESIDEMVAVFGKEAVAHFCICNVWKYRYRSANKGGEEDIAKSDWYMKKYIELTRQLNINDKDVVIAPVKTQEDFPYEGFSSFLKIFD